MNTFLPRIPSEIGRESICAYLLGMIAELAQCPFTEAERDAINHVKMLGRLLNPNTRAFFLYHFGPMIEIALRTLFRCGPNPSILDLGCGTGSMSILFALLGSKVVALDLNATHVSACRKRQAFYEKQAGPLDLEFRCANAFEFSYESIAPLDGIYSLCAFNLMQPSHDLLRRFVPSLKPDGVFVMSDGNSSSFYNRIFRPRPVLSPQQMVAELAAVGCSTSQVLYDCMLPPSVLASKPLFAVGSRVEKLAAFLGIAPWLAVSYTLVAERSVRCAEASANTFDAALRI